MNEVFKDVKGYEGLYQISNLGRVKSLERKIMKRGNIYTLKEKILKPCVDNEGYLHVRLCNNTKPCLWKVHQLVALAFLNHDRKKAGVNTIVHHINGNKKDNRLVNLEIQSRIEHSRKHKIEYWSR